MRSLIYFALLLTGFPALAGPRVVGNGGSGVVCHGSDGKITSVTVLDLYEASVVYGLAPAYNASQTFDEILASLASKLAASQGDATPSTYEKELRDIRVKMRLLPSGVRLNPVEDTGSIPFVPEGCEIRQLANYRSESTFLVDGDYWQAMNDMNRAALVLHELVYKIMRYWGDVDSIYSRKVVSYLLTTEPLEPIIGKVPEAHVRCVDTNPDGKYKYEFLAYPSCGSERCTATLQFRVFDGRLQFSKRTIDTNLAYANFLGKDGAGGSSGQNFGQTFSKLADGEELWWRYQTGAYENPPYIKLSLAVSTNGQPESSEFQEMMCVEQTRRTR